MELRREALRLLQLADPAAKAQAVRALADAVFGIDAEAALEAPPDLPGRPPRPQLVAAKDVPTRSPFTTEGRAALLHAIAHIEFNAIKFVLPVDTSTDWPKSSARCALDGHRG